MTFRSLVSRAVAALACLGAFAPAAFAFEATSPDARSALLVAQNESPSSAHPAVALEKVRLAYGVRVIGPDGAAYTSVPKQEKFWEKEGLAVDIQSLDTGPAFQLLAQGKLDFLIAGSGSGLPLVESGAPIKAVAAGYKVNIFYPAVLPDSEITSLKQIKGKTVGLFTPAGSAVVMLDAVLHQYGLTRKDLKGVVTVGTGASAVNALKTKQIDIYFGYQGAYNTIEASTDVRFRRFSNDPLFIQTAFASPGVWTRTALIDTNKKMIVGFLRGVNAGIAFSKKDPVAAIKDHFALYPQTKPPGSEEDAIKDGVKSLVNNLSTYNDPFGLVPMPNVEATAKIMQTAGVLKSVSPASRYYTDEFVEAGLQFDAKAVQKALSK